MTNCYEIKKVEELFDLVTIIDKRSSHYDFDYQLQTNYGRVYELSNGQVIFIPRNFRGDGLLCQDKECFQDIVNSDKFPIDNPEQEMFDVEGDRMKTFHLQIDHYRQHLNNVLKFDFQEINKEAAQAYLKKVVGRKIKILTTATDVVALISVIGELVKAETGGKWFLVKRYGTYNPSYEPNILTSAGNVYLMSSRIIGKVKWRTSKLEDIFIDVHSTLTEPIKWTKFSKNRDDLILLE